MQKFLSLSIFLFSAFLPFTSFANDFAGGNGTEAEPYLISSAIHLDNVRLHLDAHFLQINDLSLDTLEFADGLGWNPIGSCDSDLEGEPFSGSYDGGGFSISALIINRSDSIPSGLFGCTQNAVFININLVDVDVSTAYWSGGLLGYNLEGNSTKLENISISGSMNLGNFSGGLAGQGDSLIFMNCNSDLVITGEGHVGGLIGAIARGELRNCTVSGSLEGEEALGGAVGRLNDGYMVEVNSTVNLLSSGGESGGVVGEINRSTIESCTFSGEIISGNRELGGVVGIMLFGSIIDCSSDGYLECLGTGGGIIGNMANGEIINCHSTMDVNATAGGGGGLAGIANRSTISNSTYDGTVGTASSGFFSGGIVGFIGQDVELINVTSSGLIQGNQGMGGIVGSLSNNSRIVNSSSDATVIANSRAGGIVGDINRSTVDSVFFEGNVEAGESVGGIIGIVSGGQFSNIHYVNNFGTVNGSSKVGGIVGNQFAPLSISNTTNFGNVGGMDRVGGIIGENLNRDGDYSDLETVGTIIGENQVGGIFGYIVGNEQLIIDQVNIFSDITGTGQVGGVAGFGENIRITNAVVNALYIEAVSKVGGLVGELSNGIIEHSFFGGEINSESLSAGLVGVLMESTINNSYSIGTVIEESGESGGIASLAVNSTISNNYSTTDMGLDHENNLVNHNENTSITNSYFSSAIVSGDDPEGGKGLPIEEMTYRYGTDVYVDWDFNNIWRHDFTGQINDGLPFFRSSDDEGFYYVLIGVNNVSMGEADGEGYFEEGDQVTLSAEANENFTFLYWADTMGNVISEDKNYQFDMPAENLYLTAVFDDATPVRDVEGISLKFYPNPVVDQLNIQSEEEILEVKLFNTTGQLVKHFLHSGKTLSINTSELPVGTYMIAIHLNGMKLYETIQVVK